VIILIWSVGYLALHLLIISLIGMGKNSRAERSIFFAHVGSFVFLTIVLTGMLLLGIPRVTPAVVVAAAFLHAIYSLSYLEFWALSEGSLSLRILAHIVESGQKPKAEIAAFHRSLIDAKKAQRTDGLIALHLVKKRENSYRLTGVGRVLAGLLGAIGASAGMNERG